jgi:hypothetical protein
VLPTHLNDNVKAHLLQPDGSYIQLSPDKDEGFIQSQSRFIGSRQGNKDPQPPENQNIA